MHPGCPPATTDSHNIPGRPARRCCVSPSRGGCGPSRCGDVDHLEGRGLPGRQCQLQGGGGQERAFRHRLSGPGRGSSVGSAVSATGSAAIGARREEQDGPGFILHPALHRHRARPLWRARERPRIHIRACPLADPLGVCRRFGEPGRQPQPGPRRSQQRRWWPRPSWGWRERWPRPSGRRFWQESPRRLRPQQRGWWDRAPHGLDAPRQGRRPQQVFWGAIGPPELGWGGWLLHLGPTLRLFGGGGSWVTSPRRKSGTPLKRQVPSLIGAASLTERLKKRQFLPKAHSRCRKRTIQRLLTFSKC